MDKKWTNKGTDKQYVADSFYEGQSKITEPYLLKFKIGIVDSKGDYFL